MVIARRDVPRLVAAIAASSRRDAAEEAVGVVRQLAEDLDIRRLDTKQEAINVAVWLDTNQSRQPRLARMFCQYLCPDYIKATNDTGKLARRLEAASISIPKVRVVQMLVASEADPDFLSRAGTKLLDRKCTDQDLYDISRRHIDDSWSLSIDSSRRSPDELAARLVRLVARLTRKPIASNKLLRRVLSAMNS